MARIKNARLDQTLHISKIMKDIRCAMKITQTDLAKKSGVSSSAVNQIECGDRMPTIPVAMKIADLFETRFEAMEEAFRRQIEARQEDEC